MDVCMGCMGTDWPISDATNAALATLEPLNQLVVDSEEKLDLLVVTGFNMLDSKSDKYVDTFACTAVEHNYCAIHIGSGEKGYKTRKEALMPFRSLRQFTWKWHPWGTSDC